jgi:L-iditol 2-dehydrogenase
MKAAIEVPRARAGVPSTMRAVVFARPGAYAIETVPVPSPRRGEALVRVRSSMVCATDQKILAGKFPATRFPHVPGHEFSGEVVVSGDGVGLAPGARVGVEVHVGCGTCDRCREGMYTLCLNYGKRETGHAHVGFTIGGGLAEYAAVPVAALHALPGGVSFDDGAWTDNLGIALWALERGRLAAGERRARSASAPRSWRVSWVPAAFCSSGAASGSRWCAISSTTSSTCPTSIA